MAQVIERVVLSARDDERIVSLTERALSFEDSAPRGERLKLVTESYRRTEGEPAAIRRARALAHILANNSIEIHADELFVGVPQRHVYGADALHYNEPRHWQSAMDYPEFTGGIFAVRQEIPEGWKADLDYWKEQSSARSKSAERFSPEIKQALEYGVIGVSGWVHGHSTAAFDRVLEMGLDGIKAETEAKLEELESAGEREGRDFLRAVVIACDGVIQHAHRYAELARKTASTEEDATRREQLLEIAKVCERVPGRPAKSFAEALQSVWFVQRAIDMEMGDAAALANGWGRLDQYLYPCYAADIESGKITDHDVRLRLTEFYLKLNRAYQDTLILLGGLRPDGADGTNPLSYMLMEIHRDRGLLIDIDARVHSGTVADFIRLCAEVTQQNLGFSLFNDEATVAALERIGIPRAIALDYAPVGCVENIVPGYALPTTMDNFVNVGKCLELALNDGECMLTGEQLGPKSGDARKFGSFENVWEAFIEQVEYFTRLACAGTGIVQTTQPEFCPLPFYSATWWDPISKAKDLSEGGAKYPYSGCNNIGLSTAADGLAAIKKLVFEEGRIEWPVLLAALKTDFDGEEDLKAILLAEAPKYGNDDPYADRMASDVHLAHYRALENKRTAYGGRYALLLFSTNVMVVMMTGARTAATPDGRGAHEPVGISVSPTSGMDVRGPKAAMRSICALDQTAVPGGSSYIMELNTEHIRNGDGEGISVDKLADLLQYYIDLGGMNLTMNVLDPEWIAEVMQDPKSRPELSARMYGWSQYVKNLDPRLQQFLLDRTQRAPRA
ncbi:MAG TPA: pyruvate formate lyase family protein [Chloroflexota bacterium]|nr:pyruvate formate lyase family protein [Chloroflexota bacterium]